MLSRRAALGLSVVVLSACGTRAAVETAAPRPVLRISMRPGDLLSAFRNLPQFSIQTVTIGDSQKRLEALQQGLIDVTNAVADVTFLASYGRSPGYAAHLEKIRGIALMNRAVVHLLIGPNVNPRNGFRGMRIVLGDPAGGNSALGERLVNSMGVSTSAIHGEFAPYDVAVDKLLNGDVDALIATALPPEEPIVRALRGGARLVEIKGPEVDRLSVHYPLLRRTLLPRGTSRCTPWASISCSFVARTSTHKSSISSRARSSKRFPDTLFARWIRTAPRRRSFPSIRAPRDTTASARCVDDLSTSRPRQKVAIGFSTEPVAPGTATGDAVTKNSQRLRLAASLLTASRSRLSKIGTPIAISTRA
jgi:TRAP-type uncharacterized transport system substrate-binding protein